LRRSKPRFVIPLACLLIGLAPLPAQAHLVATGMGALYDGLVHFTLDVQDVLPLLALAFLSGLQGPQCARISLAILTVTWVTGGALALGGLVMPAVALSAATAMLLLSTGGLLAANLKVPRPVYAAFAGAVGFVRGVADFALATPSLANVQMLLGTVAGVFATGALAASVSLSARRFWMIVAMRVAGSWFAALGLLFAGWILR
jgi:urease accessory protein